MTELLDAPPLAWERLVEAGEVDERLVATSLDEPRTARTAPAPTGLAPALTAALARAGHGMSVHAHGTSSCAGQIDQ
jgi:hypothetical protein